MLKGKNGISLITIVITVFIIIIIMGTLVYSALDSTKIKKINQFYLDLKQLSDAVEIYYLKNGELPIDTEKSTIIINKGDTKPSEMAFLFKDDVDIVNSQYDFFNPNDYVYTSDGTSGEANYKFLKISLLDNISLKYKDATYIINAQSHTVYNYTGLKVNNKTYHFLPLTFKDTKYNEIHPVNNVRLKSINGITASNNTVYYAYNNETLNLKDLLVFDSVGEDGLGQPKEVIFETVETDFYTINRKGLLTRKNDGVFNEFNFQTNVSFSVESYGNSETINKTITIITSSLNVYEENILDELTHVNLALKHTNTSIYTKNKWQKGNSNNENRYLIEKKGYLANKTPEIITISENNQIASAVYNNSSIVFNSESIPGTSNITIKANSGGLAQDTIKVNVFDFNVFEDIENGKNIDKVEFKRVDSNDKIDLKLKIDAPEDFSFDGETNILSWSIVKQNGSTKDESNIVSISQNGAINKITLKPLNPGKTYLKCSVIVENEELDTILIPIVVSGLKITNGEAIENDIIRLNTSNYNTVRLRYEFGDAVSYPIVYENPVMEYPDNFQITKDANDIFTISYTGNSGINSKLTIKVKTGDVQYEDDVIVSVGDSTILPGKKASNSNETYIYGTKEAVIPKGFTVSGVYGETNIDDGLVIYDIPDNVDTTVENFWTARNSTTGNLVVQEEYNQYVWVPVPETSTSEWMRYEGYQNGSKQSVLSNCTEPYVSGYSTEVDEYNAMANSVIQNNGFYIGRYEASNNNGTAESKKGKFVWNGIIWGDSISDIGTDGAVYKSQQVYNNGAYGVTSTLCYGVQWDSVLGWIDSNYKGGTCSSNSFIVDSTGKGNYSDTKSTYGSPGKTGIFKEKNIYDMAGNVWEWTMDAYDRYGIVYRVDRGGSFYYEGFEYSVSNRIGYSPANSNGGIGFRVALYIN